MNSFSNMKKYDAFDRRKAFIILDVVAKFDDQKFRLSALLIACKVFIEEE